jgi:hypothetical protein
MKIETQNDALPFSETKTTRRNFFGKLTKVGIAAAAATAAVPFADKSAKVVAQTKYGKSFYQQRATLRKQNRQLLERLAAQCQRRSRFARLQRFARRAQNRRCDAA